MAADTASTDDSRVARVQWYTDLRAGKGAAEELPKSVRTALLAATRSAAIERGTVLEAAERARLEKEAQAAEAERKRREAEQRAKEEAAARKRAAALKARRAELRFRVAKRVCASSLVVGGIAVAAVPATRWLGSLTRDGLGRSAQWGAWAPEARVSPDYGTSDWAMGSAIVLVVAGFVAFIAALVIRSFRSWGTVVAWGAVLTVVAGFALGGFGASVWNRAEGYTTYVLAYTAPPPELAPCPGREVGAQYVTLSRASGAESSAVWTVGVRQVTAPADDRPAALGLCAYRGWNYVSTIPFALLEPETDYSPEVFAVGLEWAPTLVVARVEDGHATSLVGIPSDAWADEDLERRTLAPEYRGAFMTASPADPPFSNHDVWSYAIEAADQSTVVPAPASGLLIVPDVGATDGHITLVTLAGNDKVLKKSATAGQFALVEDHVDIAIDAKSDDRLGNRFRRYVFGEGWQRATPKCPQGSMQLAEDASEFLCVDADGGIALRYDADDRQWR